MKVNKTPKTEVERSIFPLLSQECAYFTYRTPPPSTPAITLRDPSPVLRSLGGPRGERLPAGLSVVTARSPGDEPAAGSQSKTERGKNPRLAHRGVWRKAVGDFSRVEESRNDSISSSCSSAEPGLPPQVRAPPPHMVCSSSSKHMNFKMVLWARGGPNGKGRIKGTWGGLAGA